MTCADFDAKIDLYIDGQLPASEMQAVTTHTASCTGCKEIVSGYEQARALLRTAVADKVTAVDVSGLWRSIEASLDLPAQPAVEPAAVADPSSGGSWLGNLLDEVRSFGAGFLSPVRAGAFAAAAAVAALLFVIATGERSTLQMAVPGSTELKPVRIDSMEVAAGHTVTTWVKPRTGTRVIWVGDGDGFSVSSASHDR